MGSLDRYGPIDTVICDIDGVVILGGNEIPGAGTALSTIRRAGLSVVFATNNAARSVETVRRRIADMTGFDPGAETIVTSAVAAARYMERRVTNVLVVGTAALAETLATRGISTTDDWAEADAVIVGLNTEMTYEMLAHAALAIQNGATFYSANSDATYPRPDGLYPGAGAIAAAVQTATGVEPIVCGKPYLPMREMLGGLGGSNRIVIGDRPDTDIALGKVEGWPTVLVTSGVVSDSSTVPDELAPDLVLESIADLPAALGLSA